MDPRAAARMFHVLVVMGAALGSGCTDRPVTSDGDEGGSGATQDPGTTAAPPPATTSSTGASTSTTGEPPSPTTSTTGALTTGEPPPATATTDALTTTGEPTDTSGACLPQQMTCEDYFPPTNCTCDLGAPLVPGDCRTTTQFNCEWWDDPPFNCHCDANAPAVPADCPFPANFNCDFYEPTPLACSCECPHVEPNPQGRDDCDGYWCEFEPVGCCCHIMLG